MFDYLLNEWSKGEDRVKNIFLLVIKITKKTKYVIHTKKNSYNSMFMEISFSINNDNT